MREILVMFFIFSIASRTAEPTRPVAPVRMRCMVLGLCRWVARYLPRVSRRKRNRWRIWNNYVDNKVASPDGDVMHVVSLLSPAEFEDMVGTTLGKLVLSPRETGRLSTGQMDCLNSGFFVSTFKLYYVGEYVPIHRFSHTCVMEL